MDVKRKIRKRRVGDRDNVVLEKNIENKTDRKKDGR